MDMEEFAPKSRAQQKRDHQAIQALGKSLVEAPDKLLSKLELPEAVDLAVKLGRKLQRGALQRHLRHLATLLEHADAEAIRARLEALQVPQREAVRRLHLLEAWREKLLHEGDRALDALCTVNRELDVQHLRQLVRNARATGGTPDPRGARALFKFLSAQNLDLPRVDP